VDLHINLQLTGKISLGFDFSSSLILQFNTAQRVILKFTSGSLEKAVYGAPKL